MRVDHSHFALYRKTGQTNTESQRNVIAAHCPRLRLLSVSLSIAYQVTHTHPCIAWWKSIRNIKTTKWIIWWYLYSRCSLYYMHSQTHTHTAIINKYPIVTTCSVFLSIFFFFFSLFASFVCSRIQYCPLYDGLKLKCVSVHQRAEEKSCIHRIDELTHFVLYTECVVVLQSNNSSRMADQGPAIQEQWIERRIHTHRANKD